MALDLVRGRVLRLHSSNVWAGFSRNRESQAPSALRWRPTIARAAVMPETGRAANTGRNGVLAALTIQQAPAGTDSAF
jgi:hypothetical protein